MCCAGYRLPIGILFAVLVSRWATESNERERRQAGGDIAMREHICNIHQFWACRANSNLLQNTSVDGCADIGFSPFCYLLSFYPLKETICDLSASRACNRISIGSDRRCGDSMSRNWVPEIKAVWVVSIGSGALIEDAIC